MIDLLTPVYASRDSAEEAYAPGVVIGRTHECQPRYDVKLEGGRVLNGLLPAFRKQGLPYLTAPEIVRAREKQEDGK